MWIRVHALYSSFIGFMGCRMTGMTGMTKHHFKQRGVAGMFFSKYAPLFKILFGQCLLHEID
jgi:hypothetical protein